VCSMYIYVDLKEGGGMIYPKEIIRDSYRERKQRWPKRARHEKDDELSRACNPQESTTLHSCRCHQYHIKLSKLPWQKPVIQLGNSGMNRTRDGICIQSTYISRSHRSNSGRSKGL